MGFIEIVVACLLVAVCFPKTFKIMVCVGPGAALGGFIWSLFAVMFALMGVHVTGTMILDSFIAFVVAGIVGGLAVGYRQ